MLIFTRILLILLAAVPVIGNATVFVTVVCLMLLAITQLYEITVILREIRDQRSAKPVPSRAADPASPRPAPMPKAESRAPQITAAKSTARSLDDVLADQDRQP